MPGVFFFDSPDMIKSSCNDQIIIIIVIIMIIIIMIIIISFLFTVGTTII